MGSLLGCDSPFSLSTNISSVDSFLRFDPEYFAYHIVYVNVIKRKSSTVCVCVVHTKRQAGGVHLLGFTREKYTV